ncbi:MAG: Glu-tRNA(Gln) amidotransferase subunit GatE [Nanoarchaeota archaeon]|nr:Glu-tRNA(Gln) amidotransferase subunit GatE [Nanoarchaeota archaeon]
MAETKDNKQVMKEEKFNFDYVKLGLKCGIEIHQQLETSKLFCNCPSLLRDDEPDIIVNRELRAVVGETGEIDAAAKHEMEFGKKFVYQAYSDTTCLVELDEEPPHDMNRDALDVALQVVLLLKAMPVDEVQIMRKTVVDGSNTTGFQRTALIATNGIIETSVGNVRIANISLEEDAAKIIGKDADKVIYRLDRLGIPLIEIGTEPDIKTPEQCKETAEKIGMFLRSTERVKRGLGTIRQDVNVSVNEGTRIEIKGAQDLKLLPKYVDYEILRQLSLLEIKKELIKRQHHIHEELVDITNLLADSESKIIKSTISKNGKILAIKLEGFFGLIGKEVQLNRRLGTEFSDYAKTKAGVGGIFHSDELPNYGITQTEVDKIKKELAVGEKDAFVLVADEKEKSEKALKAVIDRAKYCVKGVPKEVRKANPDATTSFMRPMPGAARMYPETDALPVMVEIEKVKIPELISSKAKKYEELGLSEDLATMMSKSSWKTDFESFVQKYNHVKPLFIADVMLVSLKEIKSRLSLDVGGITRNELSEVFNLLNEKKISKEAVFEILTAVAKGKTVKESAKRFETMDEKQVEEKIKEIIAQNKSANEKTIMGFVMKELRGKADGKMINEIVRKLVG